MKSKAYNTELHIGIWGERHRRYLKTNHRVRYYNLLTTGKLNNYLADINQQAEKMFDELVKSLAEKENVTEIESLVAKKNELISAGKYTDGIDDVLLKFCKQNRKNLK